MFRPSALTLSLFHGTISIAREMALAPWVAMLSAIHRDGHLADANAAPNMGNTVGPPANLQSM
jgi:hypothetical protein